MMRVDGYIKGGYAMRAATVDSPYSRNEEAVKVGGCGRNGRLRVLRSFSRVHALLQSLSHEVWGNVMTDKACNSM